MAFALKFAGIKWSYGEYSLHPIPGEIGSASSYLDDPRFRRIKVNEGYMDAFAILSPAEVLAIARPHYEQLARIWSDPSPAEKGLRDLEAALADVQIVFAHVLEWESGLS